MKNPKAAAAPGSIEPHAQLLEQPPDAQRLYRITRIPHLLDMLKNNYLHFQRVNTYQDDTFDGEQLLLDRTQNEKAAFANDPAFNLARYYDISRSRTYVCCFSLGNSKYIWENYGQNDDAVCLVFEFGKLRQTLNNTVRQSIENDKLIYGDCCCKQIFSINYGIVKYMERDTRQLITSRFANPIEYTFVKDKKYADERELRISLSALGIGHFVLNDGEQIVFPSSMRLEFNFIDAFATGTIEELLCGRDTAIGKAEQLKQEMRKLGYIID